MGEKTLWLRVLLLVLVSGVPGWLLAQERAAAEPEQKPSETDVYCAGFFTRRPIESSLTIMGGEEGGFKNEFATGDILYLSKGTGWITAPGGQYQVLRPIKDVDPRELFPGQRQTVLQMGTLYAEIARLQVLVIHEGSSTAEVLMACDPIVAGDIVIPFGVRPIPSYRTTVAIDQFAPASGKATGVVVMAKDFSVALGTGHIVYLNVGKNQGAQAGSMLRVYRTYLGQDTDPVQQMTRHYPTEFMGTRAGRKLNYAERASLPRAVLGEVLLLAVEDDSATGIITSSRTEIFLGDPVELE